MSVVLLTDGWDHRARKRTAKSFELNWADMEERHLLIFDTYEEKRITLQEYLDRVVFTRSDPSPAPSFGALCLRSQSPTPR